MPINKLIIQIFPKAVVLWNEIYVVKCLENDEISRGVFQTFFGKKKSRQN
jgi:hypothetical protein